MRIFRSGDTSVRTEAHINTINGIPIIDEILILETVVAGVTQTIPRDKEDLFLQWLKVKYLHKHADEWITTDIDFI